MTNVQYEVGISDRDGPCLQYGFLLPNSTTRDEREITDVPFRWAEKVAAFKAPAAEGCRSISVKVSAPKPQKLTLTRISGDRRRALGTLDLSGDKQWQDLRLDLAEPIRFSRGDLIEIEAEKEYLGMWRQNCYRLSTVQFDFDREVHLDLGFESFRTQEEFPYELLFGDPHVHTNASLCSRVYSFGTLQENVDQARENGLDFIHFSDHTEHFLHFDKALEIFYSSYRRHATSPFIVMPGYEWASKSYGNYNIYFDDMPRPEAYVHTWEQRGNSLPKLWAACRLSGTRFLTIPHHTYHPIIALNTSYPVPDDYQSAVEVCSCWGSSERYEPDHWHVHPKVEAPHSLNPGFYVDDLLRLGMKLGFVGGSDAHPMWPGDAGRTGVYVTEFSLKGIFEAIKARRTFATNGVNIKLEVLANGYPMGHIFQVNQYTVNVVFPLEFVIDVEGSSAVTCVELIANGAVLRRADFQDDENHRHIEWAVERGTYELTDTNRYYYVRVAQKEGSVFWPQKGMAWSSPFWIDYRFNENPVGTVNEANREFIDLYDHQMVPFEEPRRSLTVPKRKNLMDL